MSNEQNHQNNLNLLLVSVTRTGSLHIVRAHRYAQPWAGDAATFRKVDIALKGVNKCTAWQSNVCYRSGKRTWRAWKRASVRPLTPHAQPSGQIMRPICAKRQVPTQRRWPGASTRSLLCTTKQRWRWVPSRCTNTSRLCGSAYARHGMYYPLVAAF